MSFLTMFALLALWLGGLFFLVGVIWLLLRKLNRIENIVRQLAASGQHPVEETSDKSFLRKLAVAYVATLLLLSMAVMLMMAFPVGESVGTSDRVPVRLERP